MVEKYFPFVGPSYEERVINFDAQRSVNLYPIKSMTGDSKTPFMLGSTPGLKVFCDLVSGPIKGCYTVKGRSFFVTGKYLFEVFVDGTFTNLGSVVFSNSLVSITDNGLQICIVGGDNGYVFTLATNELVQITSDGWNGADTVTFLDGYGIFNWPGTSKYYISALYDFTTFDPTMVSSVASSTNDVVAVVALHQNVWVLGTQTVEIEYDSGNVNFPFQRIQGAFIEYGCIAPYSVVRAANTLFWLGQDQTGQGSVWMAQGYEPQKISTDAIEFYIQQFVHNLDGASGWSYQEEGHFFYVLNIPGASSTLVYDVTLGQWHERAYFNALTGKYERQRQNCQTFNFNQQLIGDYNSGKIYVQSLNYYDDAGDLIRRMRVAPHITSNLDYVFYNSFQVDMETGVGVDGIDGSQNTDPQLMMRYSNDGGYTWSNEIWMSMGKIGQYKWRARTTRIGRARDRVFEVSCMSNVPVNLLGAVIDAEPGIS